MREYEYERGNLQGPIPRRAMYVRRGKGRWATTWRKGHARKAIARLRLVRVKKCHFAIERKKTTAKESGAGDMIMKGSKHVIE